MKIAYVYDAVYPWETGGVQKRVWEFARRLASDHDVHWYGLAYWDGPRRMSRDGVTFHGVMEPTELYVDGRRSIREALEFSARLFGPLLGEDFDIIDCQEFPYFPVFPSEVSTWFDDATLLMTWHEVWGSYWREYLGWKGVLGQAVERACAAVPDRHVAVSGRTRRDVVEFSGADPVVVPNGISTSEIEDADPADRSLDVLFVGRFIEQKNPALVVEAVAELEAAYPDVDCLLVGDGPETGRVEEAIRDDGLESRVTVSDPLEAYEDVLGLMKSAEVFVLPSRREGFGITVLEALACGTPVVTLDHPRNAATELVTDGETGSLCDENPAALARAIDRARGLRSADCRAAAADYDWDRLAEDMLDVYTAALETERVPAE